MSYCCFDDRKTVDKEPSRWAKTKRDTKVLYISHAFFAKSWLSKMLRSLYTRATLNCPLSAKIYRIALSFPTLDVARMTIIAGQSWESRGSPPGQKLPALYTAIPHSGQQFARFSAEIIKSHDDTLSKCNNRKLCTFFNALFLSLIPWQRVVRRQRNEDVDKTQEREA